jgi:hypothetical protein
MRRLSLSTKIYSSPISDRNPVDWSGRRVDSCGCSGQGETPQEQSDEEAHLTPRGKRSAWNGNQQTCFTYQTKYKNYRQARFN